MEKFGVIKKKCLLFMMVAGLGGLKQGHRDRESQHPQVLWMVNAASQFGGMRIPGLFCIAPQPLVGPLVMGTSEVRSLVPPPFHLLRTEQGGFWNPLLS